MASKEFDSILRKTLDDHRVSRGERRVLRQILDELEPDERQRSLLRHQVFAIAREEMGGTDAADVLDWLEEVVKILGRPTTAETASDVHSRAWFSPGDDCVRAIVSMLRSARRTLDICVFTITDNRISDVIVDCHRRGIAVRIITDDEKSGDLGSDIGRLDEAGIAVRIDRSPYHMHHKFALFDNKSLLTGSYNWTRSAAESNEENLLATDDRQMVKEFSAQFETLWNALN